MDSKKTILALVDLSEAHEDVIYAAVLHACSSGGNLSVYHAVPRGISKESTEEFKQRFESSIVQILNEQSLVLKSHQVLIASEHFPNGKLLNHLITSADMVVMGGGNSRTNDTKREKIIKIVDQSPHAVLIIPAKGRLNIPERILYCSSYHEFESNISLRVVKELAQRFNAEVRVAHVKTHSGSSKQSKVDRSRFEGKYFEPEVKYAHKLIRNSDVIAGINHYIRKKGDNDLVVMIRRKQRTINRLFGSNFTNKMLKNTEIPLLILKENQLN